MVEVMRRLKPDPENQPAWLREELCALADRCERLSPEERRQAMRDQLSERARAYFREQALRALRAHRFLTEAGRSR